MLDCCQKCSVKNCSGCFLDLFFYSADSNIFNQFFNRIFNFLFPLRSLTFFSEAAALQQKIDNSLRMCCSRSEYLKKEVNCLRENGTICRKNQFFSSTAVHVKRKNGHGSGKLGNRKNGQGSDKLGKNSEFFLNQCFSGLEVFDFSDIFQK